MIKQRRVKTSKTLLNHYKNYKLVSQFSSDKIIRITPEGTILFVSQACEQLVGYTQSDLLGTNALALIFNEDVANVVNHIHTAISNNESCYTLEYRLKQRSGRLIWVETKGRILRDSNNHVTEIIAISRDTTERKNNKQKLIEREQFYRSLFTYSPDSIVVFDMDGNFVDGNEATQALIGYTMEELKQTPFMSLVVQEDLPLSLDKFERSKQGDPQRYQIGLTHKNGSRVDIEATKIPVIVDGKIVGVHAYAKDITERKKFIQEIQESEERYRSLVEQSPEMIVVITGNEVRYINEVGVDMVGANVKEDVIGRHIIDFIHPDERDLVFDRIKNLGSGIQTPVKHKLIRIDGKIIDVDVTGVTISYLGSPSIQLVISDITIRKLNEELLFKTEKLDVVGKMAAGIAHELRNPLTSLKGFLHLLKQSKSNIGESQRYMDIMSSEFNRIEQIINEFLIFSKPNTIKFDKHDIRELLESVTDLIESEATLHNVIIVRDYAEGMPFVHCEGNQLKQVFINVIKNAIEAMPDGGSIRVIASQEKNEKIHVSFIDEGIGIDSSRIARLGEPFYSTKEKGTGLGLMVCQQIVRNHNGKMMIKSVPGEGTTVEITLPV